MMTQSKNFVIMILVLIYFFITFFGVTGTGSANAATYSISGSVKMASGMGISGVTITLNGAAQKTTTTDSYGNYKLTGLANGTYTVAPSKAGYAFSPESRTVNLNGRNVTGQNFKTYSISGKVKTASSTAISGVTVTLSGAAQKTTTTDSYGNYEFTGLANGTYIVTPSKSGYTFTPTIRNVTVSSSNVRGQNFTGIIESCTMPDANGNGDSADDLQEILNSGEDLILCENQIFYLSTNQCNDTALCYKIDRQKMYTNNFPNAETGTSSAATLRINGATVSSILNGGSFSNIQLKSVVIDGNRNDFGHHPGRLALVQMGVDASNQIIEHNLFRNTRTWSALQVHEGHLRCSDVIVAYNRIENAGCDKDGNGCAPGDEVKTWADGISFACQNSLVHDNVILNATDGGIVLFAPRGSEIYNNTITAVDRIMLGGINMVDDLTYRITIDNTTYADYSNVRVYDNTIDANGNRIDVGIAQGNRVWGCPPFQNPLHGASVTNNTLRGSYMGWGAAIDGVHDWIFNNNILNAMYNGSSKPSCDSETIISAPTDCRKHAVHITGTNTFQSECIDVFLGESLHGVLISN